MTQIYGTSCNGATTLLGNEKRKLLDKCITLLTVKDFVELEIPALQYEELFTKNGIESTSMFTFIETSSNRNFGDSKSRTLCLAPEYTSVVQKIAEIYRIKGVRDMKVFYIGACTRPRRVDEIPLRFTQFTQLGVEILNPTRDWSPDLNFYCKCLISLFTTPCDPIWYREFIKTLLISNDVKLPFNYYIDKQTKLPIGEGHEIAFKTADTKMNIARGGTYLGGQGFALNINSLMHINAIINNFEAIKPCNQETLELAAE